MDGFPTEEEDGHNGEQSGQRGIDGPGQSGFDTVVNHICYRFTAAMNSHVFTDAVKNNNGSVDRVTHNSKQGSYEGRINF